MITEETIPLLRPMIMKHLSIMAFTLAAVVSAAQEPNFDSASFKVANPANRPAPDKRTSGGPGTTDPSHFYFANADMGELIMRAYGVSRDQVSGPCWIIEVKRCAGEWVNFELTATMPPDTTEERFDAMLRTLLATRFRLAIHHQTRNVPGYELAVIEGNVSPEHPVAPPGDEAWMARTHPPGVSLMVGLSGDGERALFRNQSMAEFVTHLEPMAGLALGMDREKVGKPKITDKTGLTGKYSFNFGFSCPCLATVGYQFPGGLSNDPVGVPLPNIFDALRDQLGLKLQRTANVPEDVIVVDHVERAPIP